MKIQTQLQLTFFGISFILVLGLMSIVYFSMVNHFEKEEGKRLQADVTYSAEIINQQMITRVKDLNLISNNPLFGLSSNERNSEYLTKVVEQYPFYEHISFANLDAKILASSRQNLIDLNITDLEPDIRQQFEKCIKGEVNEVFISDIDNVPHLGPQSFTTLDIELLSQVRNTEGEVIGIIIGFINLEFIADIIYRIDQHTIGDEHAYLVNHQGKVLITADEQIKVLQVHPDILENNFTQVQKTNNNGYEIYQNSKGTKVLTGFAQLDNYGSNHTGGWTLISTAQYSDVISPIHHMLFKVLLAFIAMLTLASLLIFILSKKLVKPIVQLQQIVSNFDINNPPIAPISSNTKEVGKLSTSFFALTKNLTESNVARNRAEQKLTKSEERLKSFMASAIDGFLLFDSQLNCVDANEAIFSLIQHKKTLIIRNNIFQIIKSVELIGRENLLKEIIETGNSFTTQITAVIPGSQNKILLFKAFKVGQGLGVILSDITKQIATEAKLNNALEKALESDRLKSAFLANMSHEIRTPLNGILGFINLLSKPDLKKSQIEHYSSVITKSSLRLLNTINDIMDIAKIEAGEMRISRSKTNVHNILEELYSFHSPEAIQKGLLLFINPSITSLELNITTDSHKLHGILSNLIKNAIKYTKEGHVIYGYNRTDKFIEFYVEDTGIGIPANRLNAIFNRFEQADIEDKMALEGSGLGLAITKAYAEMLGGEISVISQEGKGTTFTVRIPYTISESESNEIQLDRIDNKTNILRKLNLLVVEDDKVSSELFQATLKDKFKKIIFTQNGLEALQVCQSHSEIDLVLLDIRMPEMNGYEVAKKIREFNKDVVIIAQTAYTMDKEKKKSLAAGCNAHIAKPINTESLLALIYSFFD